MIRAAAISAAIALTAGVQEPPYRYSTQQCTVRVAFYPPRDVRAICGKPEVEGQTVLACYWRAQKTVIMPDPWHCGSPDRCAALWRHEVAHACKDWKHEP